MNNEDILTVGNFKAKLISGYLIVNDVRYNIHRMGDDPDMYVITTENDDTVGDVMIEKENSDFYFYSFEEAFMADNGYAGTMSVDSFPAITDFFQWMLELIPRKTN